MPPILDDRDVNVDDVTLFQDFTVGRNAVADDIVHRGANRLGKTLVVEWCGNSFLHVDDMADASIFVMNQPLEEMKKLYDELEKLLDELNEDKTKETIEEINLSNEELEKELDRTLEMFKQMEFDEKLEKSKIVKL